VSELQLFDDGISPNGPYPYKVFFGSKHFPEICLNSKLGELDEPFSGIILSVLEPEKHS
jgi:hypothetical protein